MVFLQPTAYGALMVRVVCLSIAVVLSLLSVVAQAAPFHKRAALRWHGYGFLPGYHQPLSNSQPIYAQKGAGPRSATGALGISTPSLFISAMMATGTISAGQAFTAAATMAAALVRAGRGHLSDRSGIAADQSIARGSLDRSDGLRRPLATSDAWHFSDVRVQADDVLSRGVNPTSLSHLSRSESGPMADRSGCTCQGG